MASFLEARRHGGQWLLRMEDLDTPRIVPGAADAILRTLEALGLTWDGPVLWQSDRQGAYEAALGQLQATGRVYACDCSRRDVSGPYPGTCRGRRSLPGPHALRFELAAGELVFHDRWQGVRRYPPARLGDPVIRRRDGLFAYQLAVVVDDAFQGVTDVVRGADLLDSTPWQMALQTALGLPHPTWAHVPLVTEPDGSKLSKSRRSVAIGARAPGEVLHAALGLLGQSPPTQIIGAGACEVLAWAECHWRPEKLRYRAEIAAGIEDLGSDAGSR